jgi:siroheme decarboxylase
MLSRFDERLIHATQAGLPLVAHPYAAVAATLGVSPQVVRERLEGMLREGLIRRIGAVPNHYAIGYVTNGMSVWDVEDSRADELGCALARSGLVSHCYLRDRHPPQWPYNLFAMVHGHNRSEVETILLTIAGILGPAARSREVLYSTRILKKAGLRLS